MCLLGTHRCDALHRRFSDLSSLHLFVPPQDERSQHQNRAKALQVLRSRLFEAQRLEAMKNRSDARRAQVGSGDRSERVRTYNYLQDRVTDHRVSHSMFVGFVADAGGGLV